MTITKKILSATASIMLGTLFAGSALAKDKPPAVSHDGLELIEKARFDVVYRRPGVDFSVYSKIMLDPVEVAFKKQWTQDFRRVSSNDRERIRKELAEEFHKIFVEELGQTGGYQIVDSPGPDVLRVTTGLLELYINAPDTMSAGGSRTYAVSTGEMTLVAEARDSESGSVIARVADREAGREYMTLQWITRSQNRADARAMLKKWAVAMHEGLDEARGVSK